MKIPTNFLLSQLLNHNVRSDLGIDHGQGVFAWMHPPVHRILGWATRTSNLRLSRQIWRLDQLRAITSQEIFVKGRPADSDQSTLERLPTLIDAQLINKDGDKIATIADFCFNIKTGNILYYLVSRSNPKLPGTSRWKLELTSIEDQYPGIVSTSFFSIDELPLIKSSIRQDLIKTTEKLKVQFQEISSNANNRLEDWLEESSLNQESINYSDKYFNTNSEDSFDISASNYDRIKYRNDTDIFNKKDEDPWI